jgi:hypothetical protein
MFNAVLEEQSEQPFTPTGYTNRLDLLKLNFDRWRSVLSVATDERELPEMKVANTFHALLGVVPALALVEIIDQTSYLYLYGERSVAPKTAFYRRIIEEGELEDFLVIVPQPATSPVVIEGVGSRSVVSRDRRAGRGGKFGEITEPKHRPVVETFVSGQPDESIADLYRPARGAMLLYVVRENEPDYEPSELVPVSDESEAVGLIAAFSAYLPSAVLASGPLVLKFRVHDRARRYSPTVDVSSVLS